MWDKLAFAVGGLIVAGGSAFVAWWAYKQWKNGLRDEICGWLRARPNITLCRVFLSLVNSFDEALARGESEFRCRVLGETAQGRLMNVTERRMTQDEMRAAGLLSDSGVKDEVEIFSTEELAAMTA